MDTIAKMTGPLATAWARLNPIQKATATLMGALALVGLVIAMGMATRPQYSVLFSSLSASDAGAIVGKLKEQKIDYRVAAGGTAVEVPSDSVYDLRLQMAGQGLPQGGTIGFEIFDKSSFGATEFTQKLNYQRALQGELAKTISELTPVSDARVHLVIPEQSLYSETASESTASVVLRLKSGGQLGPDQVAAITNLISAAVQGLKPSNVAVVDTAGNLLSDAGSGPLSGNGLRLSNSQMQMQKQYEGQMARDLQAMLDKVLGAGKAVVRVNARMNFDSTQTDKETYVPALRNEGVVVSQEQMQETYGGGVKPAGAAVPLVVPVAGAAGAAASGANYNRTQTTSKYEVSKQIQHIIQAPGKVERLSVAVLLDGQVTPVIGTTIRQTVSTAVGLDTKRGDQITVDSLPFNNTAVANQDKEMEAAAKREMIMNLARWGATVLLGLVFLLFLRSFLSNWRPIETTESYPHPLPLRHAEALEMTSDDEATPRPIQARKVADIAMEKPEDTARVVRGWLAESQ